MDIAIDPNFSVYGLVERVRKSNTQLNHRRTMSLVSHEIENATIIDGVQNRIFSGFQYFSKFIPQIENYTKVAANAESVYVFGVPDVELPAIPKLHYIPLKPGDHLAREWFLVSYGPEYTSALSTQELTDFHEPDSDRVFRGLWTFDTDLVAILETWLTSTVDARPLQINEAQRDQRKQVRLMNYTLNRVTERLNTALSQRDQLRAELHRLVGSQMEASDLRSTGERTIKNNVKV